MTVGMLCVRRNKIIRRSSLEIERRKSEHTDVGIPTRKQSQPLSSPSTHFVVVFMSLPAPTTPRRLYQPANASPTPECDSRRINVGSPSFQSMELARAPFARSLLGQTSCAPGKIKLRTSTVVRAMFSAHDTFMNSVVPLTLSLEHDAFVPGLLRLWTAAADLLSGFDPNLVRLFAFPAGGG